MAQIKLKVEMNRGRLGAPLQKLGDVSRQLDRFLRALASDMSLEARKGEWLAVNFENGSVRWDAALEIEVSEPTFERFNRAVEFVADFDGDQEGTNGLLSDATLLEYARIGSHIDPDEVISLGLYANSKSKKPKKWRQITYRKAAKVRAALERPIEAYGSIQGIMHSWIKEGTSPHFQVRELATEALIRCHYGPHLYDDVVAAFKDKTAVVFATGALKLDRAKRQVDDISVERIDRCEHLSEAEFDSFFGSAPDLTGRLTTNQFIRSIREDG